MSQPALLAAGAARPDEAARTALCARFEALHAAVDANVSEYAALTGESKALAQRRLLLNLELPLKLQEQLLLPALKVAEPGWAADVDALVQELALVRDAGELLRCSAALCHELALALLHGLARLHRQRLQALLNRPGAAAVDWPALEREADAMLERWAREVRASGDIEDEDGDPVGAPAR